MYKLIFLHISLKKVQYNQYLNNQYPINMNISCEYQDWRKPHSHISYMIKHL